MPYIKGISVRRCRNVRDLEIDLSVSREELDGARRIEEQTERTFRHLILTGPNGSGKTGILERVADCLVLSLFELGGAYSILRKRHRERPQERTNVLPASPMARGDAELNVKQQGGAQLFIKWNEENAVLPAMFADGTMIGIFVSPGRRVKPSRIKGPARVSLDPMKLQPEASLAPLLLQFLVNKQFELALAAQDGDKASADRIQNWLDNFEKHMRWLTEDDHLRMEFRRDSYNFYFHRRDGYTFDLNTLADGHAAVLAIMGEILLRIEAVRQARKDFDFEPEGVVIVDEIETHLHLGLQEKILPMLTELFPKLQFLVATHSPAVIASIPGAVVCDLGTREQSLSDAYQGVPYGALMTGHFGISSDIDLESTRLLKELRRLAALPARSPQEERDFSEYAHKLALRSPMLANEVWMIQQRIKGSGVQTNERKS